MILKLRRILRLGRRQEGAAAVEFALCLIPLLLIVGGIIDYGQLWYMQSVLANASREGARYATRWHDTGTSLSPTTEEYITSKYAGLLPNDNFNVSEETGTVGTQNTIKVTVTAEKHWLFLHNLIPGLTNPQPLSSSTVMTLE